MKPSFMERLTPEQKTQLGNITLVYIAWVVVSIFAWCFLLPEWLLWMAYLPVAFAMLAVIITGIAIICAPILPKPITRVYVGSRCITCCNYCPMADIKDNIVNSSFPVVTCRETAKISYTPNSIPRWCPYAD